MPTITIRVSEQENERLRADAEKAGLKVSEWIRFKTVGPRGVPTLEITETTVEVHEPNTSAIAWVPESVEPEEPECKHPAEFITELNECGVCGKDMSV